MAGEDLRFTSSDSLDLEGRLDAPDDPVAAFVLCHPHPQMGGTMNAPLLLALTEALNAGGWAVLRFNFRGIGASEGTSSTGTEEVQDALGAVRLARSRHPGLPLAIGGWSFGAAVAVRAALAEPELVGCVAIAPPVTAREGVTEGLPDPSTLALDVPLLVVCAANDELVDASACRSWSERAAATRHVELPGANHFFWAQYDNLTAAVTTWLGELI